MSFPLKKTMVMTSHLSDIQEMMSFGDIKGANLRVNYVKMLIHDKRTEMTENELNKLWRECCEKYGK